MLKRIYHRIHKKPKAKTTPEEILDKRQKIADAASSRQNNWRQKSSSVNSKDKIIANIRSNYIKRGKDEPIGLYSSSLEVLKKHLIYIKTL
jgi:hypothetical protein